LPVKKGARGRDDGILLHADLRLVSTIFRAYLFGMITRLALPLLPDGSLPPLALLMQWLMRIQQPHNTVVTFDVIPSGNGNLPDLFASAGIERVALTAREFPPAFRWDGWAGGRVVVNADVVDDKMPVHVGDLPSDMPLDQVDVGVWDLLDLARLEDANAASHRADTENSSNWGAAWNVLFSALKNDGSWQAPAIPPLARHGAHAAHDTFAVWNPLPLQRRALAALPLLSGTPPWGFRSADGARYPVQVVEGPLGRELLTILPLAGLAATTLEPLHDPVASGHGEISRTVLDNGRVRVELDPLGQIIRLCCDGRFIDWAGPALHPLLNDLPLSGPVTSTVLEDGPVRFRLSVQRHHADGQLTITYSLHAGDSELHVAVSWSGEAEIILDLPTIHRAVPAELCGDMTSWLVRQRHDARISDAPVIAGIRWARLIDADGHGLALASGRPLTLSLSHGHVRVHVARSAHFVISENARGPHELPLGHLSLSLTMPHRAASVGTMPAVCRCVGGAGAASATTATAIPWWIRRPVGWMGEILLVHQRLSKTRTTLFIPHATSVERCNLRGETVQKIPLNADGDGYDVDVVGGGFALIRWR
jgi:hypothetical protein